MLQSLREMKLDASADALEAESGLRVDAPMIDTLSSCILQGKWVDAERVLVQVAEYVDLVPPDYDVLLEWQSSALTDARTLSVNYIRFLLYKQQFLELLESRQTSEATKFLRMHVMPLSPPPSLVQQLTNLLLCPDTPSLYACADWTGAGVQSRQQVLDQIQPWMDTSAMVPRRRLHTLLVQALTYQRMQHPRYVDDPRNTSLSLLCDYDAKRPPPLPSRGTHILRGHTDEVWAVRFSHDGEKLASAGKDGRVIVWDACDDYQPLLKLGHAHGVHSIDWSKDDRKLAVAMDEAVLVWDLEMLRTSHTTWHKYTVSSVRWLPTCARSTLSAHENVLVTGGMDGHVAFWDATCKPLHTLALAPCRITALDVSPDGTCVVILGWLPPRKKKRLTLPRGVDSDTRMLMESAYIPEVMRRAMHDDPLLFLARRASGPPAQVCPEDDEEEVTPDREETRVFVYSMIEQRVVGSTTVPSKLQHVAFADDSRHVVLNEAGTGTVRVMDVLTRGVIHAFPGAQASRAVVRSALGCGTSALAQRVGPSLVASGSEDARVYMWHRTSGERYDTACQHESGCVNDVAWVGGRTDALVTCGDDSTVRLWHAKMPADVLAEPIVQHLPMVIAQAHAPDLGKAYLRHPTKCVSCKDAISGLKHVWDELDDDYDPGYYYENVTEHEGVDGSPHIQRPMRFL